jgi:hypothetical protein
MASGGDRDRDPARDLRQQAHRHELGGADREATHGQGEDRQPEVAGEDNWRVVDIGGVGRRRHRHFILQG